MKINYKFKLILINFFLFFLFLFFISLGEVFAVDFKTDYQFIYNLSDFEKTQKAEVNFQIKITNLRSDIYINKYSISFPQSFIIEDLVVYDDNQEIIPEIFSDSKLTKIQMSFSNPKIGKDLTNSFNLKFKQKNLFKINGNIWEVLLPVIEKKNSNDSYKVIVILPEKTNKKISIAKPKPTFISENQIIWDNPQTKMIYAVFGESQIYKLSLKYSLKNKEIYPVITEIALPPDTLYQKVYYENINPRPKNVYQDEDDNLLAQFSLNPLEEKNINFNGYVEVFSKPREELIDFYQKQIHKQRPYLLSDDVNWKIINQEKIKSLETIENIYRFTVDNLTYNYNKINQSKRLGADNVLKNPSNAVCLEFSDLFIGISREKGFLSRELQGYGFSFDEKLQPLSLVSDVLHSWPEYYDENKKIWIPIDPTWENTSGIDYFSSFDLNHIVFVIHGKRSDYPYPAGMYKTSNSKDVLVDIFLDKPQERTNILIDNFSLEENIFQKKAYQGKFFIVNLSNVYQRKIPIKIKSKGLILDKDNFLIENLAPYEKKEINFQYQYDLKNKEKNPEIRVLVFDKEVLKRDVKIVFNFYEKLPIFLGVFLLIFFIKKIFNK